MLLPAPRSPWTFNTSELSRASAAPPQGRYQGEGRRPAVRHLGGIAVEPPFRFVPSATRSPLVSVRVGQPVVLEVLGRRSPAPGRSLGAVTAWTSSGEK